MVPLGDPPAQFRRREDRRVHRSPEAIRESPHRAGDVLQADLTDDHQVHVAGRQLLAAGDGSVDERGLDAGAEGTELGARLVDEAGRLDEQRLELVQERALRVRLVVDVSALVLAKDEACLDEPLELPVQPGLAHAEVANELAGEPALLRPEKHRGEDGLAQGGQQGVERAILSHMPKVCSQVARVASARSAGPKESPEEKRRQKSGVSRSVASSGGPNVRHDQRWRTLSGGLTPNS